MKQGRDANAEFCLELVRANDLDRYLSTLLAEKGKHRALFAIYAFDADVCNIAGQVSEPGIGEIRLQWWRNEIEAVYTGKCENHPIALELQSIVHRHDLPRHLFTKLIDTHQFDLYQDPMANLQTLLEYQSATSTAITDLACRTLIGYDALEIDLLIEKAGVARGLGRMLQTLPAQIARKQCFLPNDLLQQHQLDAKNLLAGDNSAGMRLVIRQIQHVIDENLQQLRQGQGELKKAVLPAFFPAGLADVNLNKLTAVGRNPLTVKIGESQLKMQWRLLKKSLLENI